MRLTYCLFICVIQIVSYANAKLGKYTVIAPGTIHSNEKYTAAVAVHHTSDPCQIKVGIVGPSFQEIKQVEVSQNEVKNVEFDLPILLAGDYNLTAEGVNCLDNFKNSTKLIYNKFNNHVRIQTDKGLYRAGDDINFRVLFMNKDLRPAEPEENVVIWLEDANRNRIKEIRDFKTFKGVFTGKFSISDSPVRGKWSLNVNNGGKKCHKVDFEVNKHVLPKFVIKVEAKNIVSGKDGENVQGAVRATYNDGRPLEGKATIFLDYDLENMWQTKIVDLVNGKAKFDLNIIGREFCARIEAIVEEKLTGSKMNDTFVTKIRPHRYAMNCITVHTSYSFEAGKENDVVYQITHVDGSYLNDTKSNVELIYKEVLREPEWYDQLDESDEPEVDYTPEPPVSGNLTLTFKGQLNETGFVTFKVSLPDLPGYKGYSHHYSMELKYLDEQTKFEDVYQQRKPIEDIRPTHTKDYFYFSYSSKKFVLNETDHITLISNKPIPYIIYHVVGRGNILKSERIDFLDKPVEYNLTLTPDISWAPVFAVYAYYVDKNGEYHYANQRKKVDYELQNQIILSAAQQVKPGQEVAFKIHTTPNSFVGLMAVSQDALEFRSNKDFHSYNLNNEINSYHTESPDQGGYSNYPGSFSGCVTLTNANYFYNWTRPEKIKHGWKRNDKHYKPIRTDKPFVKAVQVPKDFAHTWIFADIENTEAAEFIWSKKIPETMTSWVLTAFSMSPEKGLGLTSHKTKISAFKHFFVSVRLPYSVKKGEVINVPAFVFNYLKEDLDVEITMDNSDDEYEFSEFDNEVFSENKRTKSVRVPANGAAGVSFLLKPKVIGNIILKFTATSPEAGEKIYKFLKVVPDGIAIYVNRAYLIYLHSKSELKSLFELESYEGLVPDSEHVEIGAVGDILGPVLNNLNNLVRLPHGSGEQIMSTLLINYVVMKHLERSNRLLPSLETKLRYNLETGYQNLLKYRNTDGSFSSFNPSYKREETPNGSTWLTAYVVPNLQQIKQYVDIENKIIKTGLAYLSQRQTANGSLTEKGDYLFDLQRNDVVLTSAAVLAFLESATHTEKYFQELDKALEFISLNIDSNNSLYAKALGTYALAKGNHATADQNLSKLKSVVKSNSHHMWWSTGKKELDVEITSYALLTLLNQDSTRVDDVLPIIRWLIAQRNSYGGFASTQDTVVGLTALTKFAMFANNEPAKMNVDIKTSDSRSETIKLTEDNGLRYQSVELPPHTKSIEFTATGTGLALVQIAHQYNVLGNEPQPSFTINTTKTINSDRPSQLDMTVCARYIGDGESSNMAILEISTPSGYIVDGDKVKELKKLKRVRSTELKNSDSLLVIIIDHLYKKSETCLKVRAYRIHSVANQRPASIVLYDFYETARKVTAYYEALTQISDICETEEQCRTSN